ncbi:hypothetical protein [Roseicella sp. DB1501]|uniref:hypothetical protein n=1 Tax=Roseicella sp. DB1501 TaxID=2730925 RepID=UPI0014929BC0|nr:hypothetical protein [Roseicella sp. DB1501]NOG70438.1 hypothetical protein [Roseicella sp. DB1501]
MDANEMFEDDLIDLIHKAAADRADVRTVLHLLIGHAFQVHALHTTTPDHLKVVDFLHMAHLVALQAEVNCAKVS